MLHRSSKESRLDLDDEDDQESYFKARKDLPLIAYPEDEEEMEYDSDGNPIPPERSKVIIILFIISCLLNGIHRNVHISI